MAAIPGRLPTEKLFLTSVYEVIVMFKAIKKGFEDYVTRVGGRRLRREFLVRR